MSVEDRKSNNNSQVIPMVTQEIKNGKQFFNECESFLDEFTNATGISKFVPCKTEKGTTRKPPAIDGYPNPANHLTIAEMIAACSGEQSQRMESAQMIALSPQDYAIIFDADGYHAIQQFLKWLEEIDPQETTLHPSSLPGEREAWVFLIPEKYRERFKQLNDKYVITGDIMGTPGKDQLEIRKGANYQVIYGYHPSGRKYKQLGTIALAYLSDKMCDWMIDNLEQWIHDQKVSHGIIADSGNNNGNGNGKKAAFNGNDHSTNGNGTYHKDSHFHERNIDIETLLCNARTMIEMCVAVGYYDLGDRDIRRRIGAILHSIDEGAEGSRAIWDDFCQRHESFDLTKSDKVWSEYKVKIGGLTYGALVWDFRHAFPEADKAAKADTASEKLKAVVEAARAVYSDIQGETYPILQFFEQLDFDVENVQGIDINGELIKYSQLYRYPFTSLQQQYEQRRSLKNMSMADVLQSLEVKKTDFDVLSIYRSIPDSQLIVDAINARQYDLLACLMFWLNAIASSAKKTRKPQFSDKPCPMTLFTVINGESGKGKSPIYEMFTDSLLELDSINREIDKMNMEVYRKAIAKWNDLGKKEKGNFNAPVYMNSPYDENTEVNVNQNKQVNEFSSDFTEDNERSERPEEPTELRNFIYGDGTIEDMEVLQSITKDFNILWCVDEVVRILKTGTGYGQQNGTSKIDAYASFIKMWNGQEFKKRTISRGTSSGIWGIGLIGGIQPDVLQTAFNLSDDSQGFAARMIILDGTGMKMRHRNPNKIKAEENHKSYLMSIYEKVFELPGGILRPSDLAWEAWDIFNTESMAVADNPNITKGFALWLRKIGQNCIRIASALYSLKVASGMAVGSITDASGDEYEMIDDESVYQAIAICKQLRIDHANLYGSYMPKDERDRLDFDPGIREHVKYILDYLGKQNGAIALNKIRGTWHFKKTHKMSSAEVKTILDELVAAEKVEFTPGQGYSIKKA